MSKLILTSVRLSLNSIKKINDIATKQHLPARTLIRAWIMQRLDTEEETSVPEEETSVPEALAGRGTEARTQPAIKEACPND